MQILQEHQYTLNWINFEPTNNLMFTIYLEDRQKNDYLIDIFTKKTLILHEKYTKQI